MLIYNTTFHVEMGDARYFVIWLNEFYIPVVFFFFNDTATTEIYTLSLHDALPI